MSTIATSLSYKNNTSETNTVECELKRKAETLLHEVDKRMKRVQSNQEKGYNQRACNETSFDKKYVVTGSFNQGDSRFSPESRGTQCSCNALTALCHFCSNFRSTTEDLDNILKQGDTTYKIAVQYLKQKNCYTDRYLQFNQLPATVYYSNQFYDIQFQYDIGGVTHDADPTDMFHIHSIQSAIDNVFPENRHALMVVGGYTICMSRSLSGDYVLFDSHSRSKEGLVHSHGTSVAMYFSNKADLVNQLKRLCNSLSQEPQVFDLQVLTIKPLRSQSCIECAVQQKSNIISKSPPKIYPISTKGKNVKPLVVQK